MSDELTRLDEQVLRLVRAVRRPGYRDRLLEGVDVGPGVEALSMLRVVERRRAAGERPSINEVAADLRVEQSTASRAVGAAIRRGLLERAACADDLRRARLDLTSAGRAALDRATANRQQILAEATTGLAPEDLGRLCDLLERLLAGYDDVEARHG
ncbi:MarR family winged helix-turn-helix transcriptional regulator [Nocardioides humi]|uniref:HTH marR-type domain-containing protein n=1 Tax=Nocardioides humi TaxID=449461 RepID=A0ABN1ZUL5_9ACTN|nr:MarR family winged helix-turn-helix transcriptional regulator [Nocardioides humi]